MKKIGVILVLFLLSDTVTGQLSGTVNYEKLGIRFDLPSGWEGQEGNGVLMCGSRSVPGLLLVMLHPYSNLQELMNAAKQGYSEGAGTSLHLEGIPEKIDGNTLAAEFVGNLDFQPAKAFVVGVINPYGRGMTIMAVTTTDKYTSQYRDIAMQLKNSIVFTKPDTSQELEEWKSFLSNVRLTYMDSYSSSSYTDGGISGGYSSEQIYHLCEEGFFKHSGSSSVIAGGDGATAYSDGNSRGSGSWKIEMGADGNPVLFLQFNNGNVSEFILTYENEKLYLNGSRYYRTTSGQYAPDCY